MASSYIDDLIRQNASRAGIDHALLDSLVYAESGYDPGAVSPKGARGLGQIMPATAGDPGNFMPRFDPNKTLDDPEENIRFTADYLKGMLDKFNGVYDHALAAYNWGPSHTKRWVDDGADISKLPNETHDYVGRIKQRYIEATKDRQEPEPQALGVSTPYALGDGPSAETKPLTSAFNQGEDYKPRGVASRVADEVEAASKSLYSSFVDFGALLTDMVDLGIGDDDATDQFAAKIAAHADRVRESVPEWMKADLQREIISRDAEGNIKFDMPSIRQVAHLILESAVPSGAIVGGGLKLAKGLSKLKRAEKWIKAGNENARFSRASGLRAGSLGAANSSYITVDTYRTVYEDVLDTAREEGMDLKAAHDEAGKAAMFAAGIIAPLSFVTGAAGEGMAATGKNLWTRLAKGFVGGGVTEFPEEAGQSVAEDLGADRDVDYTKAANRGMLGVFGAGVTEGGMAAVFGKNEVKLPPPPNKEIEAGIQDTEDAVPPAPAAPAAPVKVWKEGDEYTDAYGTNILSSAEADMLNNVEETSTPAPVVEPEPELDLMPKGTVVRMVGDPDGQQGFLTGKTRERAGKTSYQVGFPDYYDSVQSDGTRTQYRYIRAYELEAMEGAVAPETIPEETPETDELGRELTSLQQQTKVVDVAQAEYDRIAALPKEQRPAGQLGATWRVLQNEKSDLEALIAESEETEQQPVVEPEPEVLPEPVSTEEVEQAEEQLPVAEPETVEPTPVEELLEKPTKPTKEEIIAAFDESFEKRVTEPLAKKREQEAEEAARKEAVAESASRPLKTLREEADGLGVLHPEGKKVKYTKVAIAERIYAKQQEVGTTAEPAPVVEETVEPIPAPETDIVTRLREALSGFTQDELNGTLRPILRHYVKQLGITVESKGKIPTQEELAAAVYNEVQSAPEPEVAVEETVEPEPVVEETVEPDVHADIAEKQEVAERAERLSIANRSVEEFTKNTTLKEMRDIAKSWATKEHPITIRGSKQALGARLHEQAGQLPSAQRQRLRAENEAAAAAEPEVTPEATPEVEVIEEPEVENPPLTPAQQLRALAAQMEAAEQGEMDFGDIQEGPKLPTEAELDAMEDTGDPNTDQRDTGPRGEQTQRTMFRNPTKAQREAGQPGEAYMDVRRGAGTAPPTPSQLRREANEANALANYEEQMARGPDPEFFGIPGEPKNPAPDRSGSPPTGQQQSTDPNDLDGADTADTQAVDEANAAMEGADPDTVVSDLYTPMTEEQAAQEARSEALDSLIHFTSGTWGDAWHYLTTGINPNAPGGRGSGGGGWNLSRKRDWGQFRDLVNRARGRSNRIWMERLIDRHYTVKQIQDLMASNMITKDPYRLHDAMTRTGAVSDIQIKEFQREYVQPLSEKLEEKQVPWSRLNLLIAALHASSRNDFHLAKTFGDKQYNPLGPDKQGGSGASFNEAMEIIEEFTEEFGADMAAELENLVFAITEKYREVLAPKSSDPNGGDLTTTEDYEKWKVDQDFLTEYRRIRDNQGYAAAHDHNSYGTAYKDRRVWSDHMRRVTYTPMMGIEEAGIVEAMLGAVDDSHTGFTSELDVAGFEVKEAEGRQGKGIARDAVTHLEQQVYRAIVRSNRNAEIMSRLWNLVDALGDNRIGVALPPTSVNDREYTDAESLRRLAERNYPTEPSELTVPKRYQRQAKPFVFRMKMGDEVKAVIIYDAALAVALSNQQTSRQLDMMFSTLNNKTSYIRRMFTSWNPAFTLTNFVREVANARIQARSIKGLTEEQQKVVTKAVNLSTSYDWGMAYWREERNPDEKLEDMEPEEARIRDMIRRLREAGMHSAFHQMRTPQEVAHEMEVASRQLRHIGERKGLRGTIRKGFSSLAKILEDAANASENGVRAVVAAEVAVALSESFVANGMPEEEAQAAAIKIAASAGKELSVNFQRFGTWGSRLNTMYFFYNPSVQGLYRAKQAMHHKGVRHIAFGIGMTGVAMAVLNRMLAGDDDDGRNIYETSIPDWKRERNMIIMAPGGEGRHISIPLPYMYNLPYMIGDKLVSAIMGAGDRNETTTEAVTDLLARLPGMAMQNLSPITSNSLARAIIPSAAEPAYDIAKNQSWFNTYINPPKNIYDPAPVPDAFNVRDPDKDKISQFLAQMISTSSEFEKGMIDVSPGSLEYLFKYYTGGAGSFVPRLVESAFLMVSGEPDESIRTAPIIRRFYGLGGSAPDDRSRYYELRSRLAQVDKQRMSFRESFGDDPAAYNMFMELEGHHYSTGVMAKFKMAEKRVRMLSRQRNKIRKLKGKTPAQLRRIEALDERLVDTMVRFNEQYFDAISMEGF